MTDRNQPSGKDRLHNDKGEGPQGVDKAPGEEPAQSTENFISQTQKGKNQVDADLSKESDQPLKKQELE